MTARPDVIFLVLDTQRVDRLSSYGYELETSPQFDVLAADSTRFTNAMSAAQWTIPSHASMFTGQYPSVHTTVQSFSRLPASLPTLAERLRDGGYFTAAFCNNPLVGVVDNGLRRGFYSFLNYSGLLTSRPNQAGIKPNLTDRYRQWFKRILSAFITRIQDAFARSDALLAFSFTPLMVPLWQTALSFKGNTVKSLQDATRLLIERKGVGKDQPVFAFINLMGTHMPYHPKHRFLERFAPHVLQNPAAQRYLRRFNSDIYGWFAPLTGEIDDERKAILDGVYNAEVAEQDEQIGTFFKRLKSTGVLDRTMVVVCADHGEHLGEKQLIGHALSAYNELVHVPLIIRDPIGDLPRRTTVNQVVSTRRLFQTVLTSAGLADESERAYTLAHSAASDPDRGTVFAEALPLQNAINLIRRRHPEMVRRLAFDQPRRAVWRDSHKLISVGDEWTELYSVTNDPREKLNLHDIMPEQVEDLQEYLRTFVEYNSGIAPNAEQVIGADDPEVRRRLRDLGYLE